MSGGRQEFNLSLRGSGGGATQRGYFHSLRFQRLAQGSEVAGGCGGDYPCWLALSLLYSQHSTSWLSRARLPRDLGPHSSHRQGTAARERGRGPRPPGEAEESVTSLIRVHMSESLRDESRLKRRPRAGGSIFHSTPTLHSER